MPGSNAGTGQPLCFKCPKCATRPGNHRRIMATGRTRPLAKAQQGHGGSRVLRYRAEYTCRACSHTGWSRHIDMEDWCGAKPPAEEVKFREMLGRHR